MIFYFTGTGNSLYAAGQLAGEERLIDIGECVKNKEYHFRVEKEEKAGIVFPVYYGGLPSIVVYFLNHLELEMEEDTYLYGVMTYGGIPGAADRMLARCLHKRGYVLDAVYGVRMPKNYVALYNVPDEKQSERVNRAAKNILAVIREKIEEKEVRKFISGPAGRAATAVMYPLYRNGRKTEYFYVDERCVGCGACANYCRAGAIEMREGRPVWIKEGCIYCMGCINRCGAIQFGEKTKDRRRYVHPVLKNNPHSNQEHCSGEEKSDAKTKDGMEKA